MITAIHLQVLEAEAIHVIREVAAELERPVPLLSGAESRTTGSFILIDEATNDTVGAGMLADHVL